MGVTSGPPLPAVVERVQSFLPQLAVAERELQQRMSSGSPHVMDIENISGEEPHIEMV